MDLCNTYISHLFGEIGQEEIIDPVCKKYSHQTGKRLSETAVGFEEEEPFAGFEGSWNFLVVCLSSCFTSKLTAMVMLGRCLQFMGLLPNIRMS